MKIQVIGYNKKLEKDFSGITVSTLRSPKSLDEFDVNIIDLTSKEGLWCNQGGSNRSINSINDFISISSMVRNSRKTKIVYVFPLNVNFSYAYVGYPSNKYTSNVLLKDCLNTVCNEILDKALPTTVQKVVLAFENTRTSIAGRTYEADFYFCNSPNGITESDLSEKITTVTLGERVYGTTLNVVTAKEELVEYINYLFGSKDRVDVPDWIEGIDFADDRGQKKNIEQNQAIIDEAKQRIEEAKEVLEKNARYKSILYTNSNELVEVVFDILEHILGCDLSGFEDVRKEDFLIKTNNCTFIGEIKGVTSNIKYEHVTQVELHYRGYLDRLEEEGMEEKVKQILIMNPFRTKPIDKRDPVCEDQIKLAERNECLIIETNTLLRVFEKFCNGEIDVQKCIDIFSGEAGLLSLDAFT